MKREIAKPIKAHNHQTASRAFNKKGIEAVELRQLNLVTQNTQFGECDNN